MSPRTATVHRKTSETEVQATLTLDGEGRVDVSTGLGFLDHMITALGKHARFDLTLRTTGDLHIDDHHTVEDTALVLGQALSDALGDRRGIRRFGADHAPLDEALCRAVVDLSGRPWPEIHLGFVREQLGGVSTENLTHFLVSFAISARMNLHVDLLRGSNDHHKAEAGFKATALALRQAVARTGSDDVPSTKGVLG
jgi:imidazoleglycerol-phosphate dehydratase